LTKARTGSIVVDRARLDQRTDSRSSSFSFSQFRQSTSARRTAEGTRPPPSNGWMIILRWLRCSVVSILFPIKAGIENSRVTIASKLVAGKLSRPLPVAHRPRSYQSRPVQVLHAQSIHFESMNRCAWKFLVGVEAFRWALAVDLQRSHWDMSG